MSYYKVKHITVSVDTEDTKVKNDNTHFYTMDIGTASLKYTLLYKKKPFNLEEEGFTPTLSLLHSDGSVWLYQKMDILDPEKGEVEFVIPNNIIKHAGAVSTKLIIEKDDRSVHVDNYSFKIYDSGLDKEAEKEIDIPTLESILNDILLDNVDQFKGDAFSYDDFTEEQLKDLKGPKGDVGPQGDTGEQGATGKPGPKGEDGKDGDSFTWEDLTEEQKEKLKGEKGDTGDSIVAAPQIFTRDEYNNLDKVDQNTLYFIKEGD